MDGRLRKLYAAAGMIVFLLLAFAVLMAGFRSSPATRRTETRGQGMEQPVLFLYPFRNMIRVPEGQER